MLYILLEMYVMFHVIFFLQWIEMTSIWLLWFLANTWHMFVQTFLDFVSQKALSIVIADGCECNALSVSKWMKMGKCFPLFPVF